MTHSLPGRTRVAGLAAALATLFAAGGASVASGRAVSADWPVRPPASPLPAAERDLPATQAVFRQKIVAEGTPLEGVAFDTNGDLLLCDVAGGRVLRVTGDGAMSEVLRLAGFGPGGLLTDQAGRLLVAAIGATAGTVTSVTANGGRRTIVAADASYLPNDLAADGTGGFYFTDFKGSAFDPRGGVHHVAADLRTITPLVTGMALPNGIARSPDGRFLWVAEHGRNRLVRITLDGPTRIAPLGIDVAYNFIGQKPDTVRTDAAGNVYVAINGQGRILVFAPAGIPVAQILLPGRDAGRNLRVTSLAIRPGGDELFIVASDGDRGGGGSVFRARALAPGHPQHSSHPD